MNVLLTVVILFILLIYVQAMALFYGLLITIIWLATRKYIGKVGFLLGAVLALTIAFGIPYTFNKSGHADIQALAGQYIAPSAPLTNLPDVIVLQQQKTFSDRADETQCNLLCLSLLYERGVAIVGVSDGMDGNNVKSASYFTIQKQATCPEIKRPSRNFLIDQPRMPNEEDLILERINIRAAGGDCLVKLEAADVPSQKLLINYTQYHYDPKSLSDFSTGIFYLLRLSADMVDGEQSTRILNTFYYGGALLSTPLFMSTSINSANRSHTTWARDRYGAKNNAPIKPIGSFSFNKMGYISGADGFDPYSLLLQYGLIPAEP